MIPTDDRRTIRDTARAFARAMPTPGTAAGAAARAAARAAMGAAGRIGRDMRACRARQGASGLRTLPILRGTAA